MDRDVYAKLIAKVKSIATKLNGMTSEVGNLSDLTTTAKTDVVSAINEIDGLVTPFGTVKSKQLDVTTISASDIVDLTGTLETPAAYGFVVGYKVTNNADIVPLQVLFTDKSTVVARLRNLTASSTSGGNIIVYYV